MVQFQKCQLFHRLIKVLTIEMKRTKLESRLAHTLITAKS
jgi:hypothetical protein